MVMCSYACQFSCSYCEIKQSAKHMPQEILYKAINLLLTTRKRECQLHFFGGEPLLEWNLIKEGIYYGIKEAKKSGKSMKFMITTNGLLLNRNRINLLEKYPVEVMVSLDGPMQTNKRHRLLKNGRDATDKVIHAIKLLQKANIKYFINVVVTPTTAPMINRNLSFLKEQGIGKAQLCYQVGVVWPKQQKADFIKALSERTSDDSYSSFLINFHNECEPTIVSQELVVDVNGEIYYDGTIFLEKRFPNLRNFFRMGSVSTCNNIDALYRSKSEKYEMFKKSCNSKQKRILDNNIDLGLDLEGCFAQSAQKSLESNEHPLLIPIIRGDFIKQHSFLKRFAIDALFLYIQGPCANNCLFCIHKDDTFSDLFKIQRTLTRNDQLRVDKLCIIGNEPLLHPQIKKIITLAKQNHFKNIEVMTSGELLSRKSFTCELISLGVSSFSLPLFSKDPDIHDLIVGKRGSFAKAIRGIKNSLKSKANMYIHTNLIRQNFDHIKDLEGFVLNKLRLPFVILPIRPKTSRLPFRDLTPSYDEIIEKLKGVNSLLGFPICVLKRIQKVTLKTNADISDSMKLYLLDQRFYKTERCKSCLYFGKCLGFFKEYTKHYSLDEIKPIWR
ncbi:radical SAM protein [Thermoproteota archaeon]